MSHADAWHKQQYEAVIAWTGHNAPAWDDLTEEQRENIRAANRDQQTFMNALGEAIATGGPLPDPFAVTPDKP